MVLFRKIKFIFFIYINFINCVKSEKDLFLALLINPEQQKLLKDFNNILTRIEIKNDVIIANDEDTNSTVDSLCRNLEKGISVIIDITFTPMPDVINIINIAQAPYVKLDITIGPFMKIAEDYLINRTATDAVFIFQRDEDVDEALYHIFMEPTLLRLAFMNGLSYDFVERLKNLRPTPSYYVMFATTSNMDVILNRISASRLFVRPDKWHLMFLDYNSDNFNNERLVEFATKISPSQDSRCKLKDSDSCRSSEKFSFSSMLFKEVLTVLNGMDKNQKTPKTWDCHNDFNETNLKDTSTELNSLVTIFKNNPIFSIKNGQVIPNLNMTIETFSTIHETYNEIAIWEQGNLKPFQRNILPARRFFRIGTTEALPWSVIRRDPLTHETILDNNGNPLWEGYCIDMIAKLSEKLSFDYEIVPPKTGTFGKRLQNGKWDGLVGDLVMGKTDLSIAALKMTSEREEVIDFIAPYFEQTGISIVIRKAVRQTSLFKFMTVLRLEVWLSIVAALVATAILIWLLDKYSPYSARNNKKAYPYPCREFTLKESFWFALTSFTPQGGGETPKAISGKTLVAAYWLFVVLMLATFTANLAAFLSVERMQTPVQSLEQLARQSRINYTVVEGSDTHKYFINMKFAEDTLYRLWKELVLNATSDQTQYRIWDYPIKEQYGHILLAINSSNPVKDATEGFRKVNEHENADFAFIHDSAEIKYEISKNCNLTEVGEVFAEQPYAIAAQQGSNLQDELSYAILELQKDRFFEGLTAKYWNHSANKECFESQDNEGITLESLGGVFIATLFGLALSMITLFGEIIYYRRKHFKVQKVSPAELSSVTRIFKKSNRNAAFGYPVTPPPPFDESEKDTNASEKPVTFGEQFVPARRHQMRIANIPVVYSRKSIHEPIEYYE